MRWRGGRRSSNIEDRRGAKATPRLLGGGIGTIVLVLVAMYFGVDPTPLMQTMQQAPSASTSGTRPSAEDLENDPLADMVYVVVADTEDVWTTIFQQQGRRYDQPTLVLFSGETPSACGLGQAAMGPFYCPADKKVYIDLTFYDEEVDAAVSALTSVIEPIIIVVMGVIIGGILIAMYLPIFKLGAVVS